MSKFLPGDSVHFRHDDISVYTVIRAFMGTDGQMVELRELPGHFAEHLFKAARERDADGPLEGDGDNELDDWPDDPAGERDV